MLFADDAAVVTHTQRELQMLMDHFSQACKDFGLIISLKKTNVLGQDILAPPIITIDDYELKVIHQFMYHGSTITDNLSLDAEIDKRIGKAATTLAHLTPRVWTNPKLTMKMKMAVYNACILSTLLYVSETLTPYAHQEKRLNTFHLRSLRCILGISWQDKVTNTNVLSHAGLPTMFTLLRKCQLYWLGHVHCMEDGWIPKDILYGELTSGQRSIGCPQLRYKDVCKRDMKALNININSWEDLTTNCTSWRSMLHKQLQTCKRSWQWWQQRSKPAKRKQQPTDQSQHTDVIYATEIVTLTLVSTATEGTAQAEQTVWTSNGWIIIIHGQPWPTEAYTHNSDDSTPEETAPPQKVAPWHGILDKHLLVQLCLIFCMYNLGDRGWLCMQVINLHRPSFTVNIKNIWKKFEILEKMGTMRGKIRGPIQIARMNMTMGSSPHTQMLCYTKNKVGVIIWLGVLGMMMHDALEVL